LISCKLVTADGPAPLELEEPLPEEEELPLELDELLLDVDEPPPELDELLLEVDELPLELDELLLEVDEPLPEPDELLLEVDELPLELVELLLELDELLEVEEPTAASVEDPPHAERARVSAVAAATRKNCDVPIVRFMSGTSALPNPASSSCRLTSELTTVRLSATSAGNPAI